MKEKKKLTHNSGSPVVDNQNIMTAGKGTCVIGGCLVFGEARTF